MRVLVATEHHFGADDAGHIYSDRGTQAYAFWQRYLTVFDSVVVVGRISRRIGPSAVCAEGPGVSFAALPGYTGPQQYLLRLPALRESVRRACSVDGATILRVPGTIAGLVEREVSRAGRPYGVEVVGDPHDVFAPGAVKHPLRPFFRWWFAHHMRRQCMGACAAAYVTANALQRRYPPGNGAFATHYSSVELPDSAFVSSARTPRNPTRFALVTVGSLAQLYKAPDVLIDAIAAGVRGGLDLRLVWVGDGKHRPELEARAARLRLSERVEFAGQLAAGEAVRERLDAADLFVLPSRTEGLPRAMIEAMARALPCIGSTAGGIPELLPPEDLVAPGDAAALAAKIREIVTDAVRMCQMSHQNLQRAREYRKEILRERRNAFYRYVRQLMAERAPTPRPR
jgi:glycosyltransferase involved in cell wall biosynthesis